MKQNIMNIACKRKAKPRVSVDRCKFRRNVLIPLPGNGVRQALVKSIEQHSVQNTVWYSWLQGKEQILSNAQ